MDIITLQAKPKFLKSLGEKAILQTNEEDLAMVQLANRELYRARSYRWADLFPDELVVSEKTISVIKNDPLISAVQTIPIKDVGRVVFVDKIIFASLEILGKNTAHDLRIGGINKKKARRAKKIIEGLLLEDQGEISLPSWIEAEKGSNQPNLRTKKAKS
jgi:hypothetical protein